jgi:AcrR family transcriptional regulator
MDRRIMRTRNLLKAALLELLKEKHYEMVSVQEITKVADVHRVTFYAHYKDKNLLMEEIIADLLTDMIGTMVQAHERKHPSTLGRTYSSITLHAFFTFIADHYDFFYLMLSDNKIPGFRSDMFEMLQAYFAKGMVEETTKYNPIDPEIYSYYIASALLGVAEQWLLEGMRYSPTHMADIIMEIIQKIPRKTIIHQS